MILFDGAVEVKDSGNNIITILLLIAVNNSSLSCGQYPAKSSK